nr:family 43 glycosylhydrolase [Bacteroides gallinarum]
MYWGNPNLYYVKLNKDMISYTGNIVKTPKIEDYQEGPWFYKRGKHYYMAFASTCCPEGIGYAMSDSLRDPGNTKATSWTTPPAPAAIIPALSTIKASPTASD